MVGVSGGATWGVPRLQPPVGVSRAAAISTVREQRNTMRLRLGGPGRATRVVKLWSSVEGGKARQTGRARTCGVLAPEGRHSIARGASPWIRAAEKGLEPRRGDRSDLSPLRGSTNLHANPLQGL